MWRTCLLTGSLMLGEPVARDQGFFWIVDLPAPHAVDSPFRAGLFTLILACLVATPAGAQSLTTVFITDPAYGVKAFDISIPAGWKFEGTVLPGPECSRVPRRPAVLAMAGVATRIQSIL